MKKDNGSFYDGMLQALAEDWLEFIPVAIVASVFIGIVVAILINIFGG